MPSSSPLWKRPRAQLYAVTAVVWLMVLGVGALAWPVALPFVLAILAAYVIDPVIVRIARVRVGDRTVPRAVAVLLVYLVLGAVAYLLAVSIVPAIYREAMRGLVELRDFLASVTPEKVEGWTRVIDAFLQRYGIPLDVTPRSLDTTGGRFSVDLAAGLANALHDLTVSLRSRVGDVVAFSRLLLSGTIRALFFVVLLFMLTAFISMDAPRILRFSESLVPSALRADFRRLRAGIDAGLPGWCAASSPSCW